MMGTCVCGHAHYWHNVGPDADDVSCQHPRCGCQEFRLARLAWSNTPPKLRALERIADALEPIASVAEDRL
jgi:hypothetical protein